MQAERRLAMQSALRQIPSVDRLINSVDDQQRAAKPAPEYLAKFARNAQESARQRILDGAIQLTADEIISSFIESVHQLIATPSQGILNGTGVIVHTNLGRSPVSLSTAQAMADAATAYVSLEVDPGTGKRGGRGREVDELLRLLTGAEASLIVNNNASAVNLVLTSLAAGRSVVVSRSEAVEIGGGFRIPDVLRQSGAELVEVGTTNRTYLNDYEQAIDQDTAALLKVHASNFLILGFTAQPSIADVSALAHRHGILAIEDAGSGCLIDPRRYGLGAEPVLQDSIAAGADVVTASGDKLLGGPQAGIILGTRSAIDRIKRHPLARAVRVDKTVQAGIAETLRHYVRGEAEDKIPIWWSISRSEEWLASRVDQWIQAIDDSRVRRTVTQSVVGGGALPGQTIPSSGLALDLSAEHVDHAARLLRTGDPALFPRIVDDHLVIDARTILHDQDADVISAVLQLLSKLGA